MGRILRIKLQTNDQKGGKTDCHYHIDGRGDLSRPKVENVFAAMRRNSPNEDKNYNKTLSETVKPLIF